MSSLKKIPFFIFKNFSFQYVLCTLCETHTWVKQGNLPAPKSRSDWPWQRHLLSVSIPAKSSCPSLDSHCSWFSPLCLVFLTHSKWPLCSYPNTALQSPLCPLNKTKHFTTAYQSTAQYLTWTSKNQVTWQWLNTWESLYFMVAQF